MPRADGDHHPDFEREPPARRWRGASLKALRRALQSEADSSPGEWVYRVLPGGAYVGARLAPTGREFRIYRREPFRTVDGPSLWSAEVRTFRHAMNLELWEEADSPTTQGPCITFREPLALGI